MSSELYLQFLNDTERDCSAFKTAKDWVAAAGDNFKAISTLHRFYHEDWQGDAEHLFRGQADSQWGLTTSLYRTIRSARSTAARVAAENDIKELEVGLLARAENAVVEAARNGISSAFERDYDKTSPLGLNVKDVALLALLQHHGAPTRLLDVSTSAKIALYFACEKDDSKDGRIFLIDTKPSAIWPPIELESDIPRPRNESRKLNSTEWSNHVYRVKTAGIDPRIQAQRGAFLVGGLLTTGRYWAEGYRPDTPWTSRTNYMPVADSRRVSDLPIEFITNARQRVKKEPGYTWDAKCQTVRIPAKMKAAIRTELAHDGISESSIFPNYSAFARLAIHVAREAARNY